MLEMLTRSDEIVALPLTADPRLVNANPDRTEGGQLLDSPIGRYLLTHDPSHLVVPEGAMVARVHGLGQNEIDECTSAAGRATARGVAAYNRLLRRIRELAADGTEDPEAIAEDELTPEQHAALKEHTRWLRRRNDEVVHRAVVDLTADGETISGPDLALQVIANGAPLGRRIVDEIAEHVLALSRLGKAMRPSSARPSGPGSLTTPEASTSARDVTDDSPTESGS